MAKEPSTSQRHVRLLSTLWFILGIIFLITAAIESLRQSNFSWNSPISLLAPLLAFIVCGLFFLTLDTLLRIAIAHVQRTEKTQETLELLRLQLLDAVSRPAPASAAIPTSPAQPATHKDDKPESNDHTRTQMLDLLQQIRDASMMSETQRQHVAARHWAKRKEHLRHRIERHMLSGDWHTAKTRLEELQALLPDDEEVKQLAERISEEHALRLDEDLKSARAQLKQLYKINAWQEAEELIAGLERKYPSDREVGEITRELENKREEVERQMREHLLSNVTEATARHDWNAGVSAVEEFLMRFPSDSLSDRLRVDLLTLRENAGAQERKEQETLFKELLKQHEYEKADHLAKALIEKYPSSSTASELAKLLPKVEELMHQEKLKRQATDTTPPGGLN